MVLHRRSAMPETTRRATLNQELIRRMVNTSEMVSNEKRVEIVDSYAEKLMNSEYPLDQTRNILIGGLKGYERLLSLSMDKKNPKWKALHMAAGWNARNRRIAKQRLPGTKEKLKWNHLQEHPSNWKSHPSQRKKKLRSCQDHPSSRKSCPSQRKKQNQGQWVSDLRDNR